MTERIPNVDDYRLIAARWKGREKLLEEFCNARPAAGWGRASNVRQSTDYPVRYWPRLAKRNVSIDQPSSLYATRTEALKAAREYRDRCCLIRAAMGMFRELDAQAHLASAGEARTATDSEAGVAEGEHATAKPGRPDTPDTLKEQQS